MTDHLNCHFKDKLLSERMSQITGGHLNYHLKCHFKDKLLFERMSQITDDHLKDKLLLAHRLTTLI